MTTTLLALLALLFGIFFFRRHRTKTGFSFRHRHYQRRAARELDRIRQSSQRNNPRWVFGQLRHLNPYVFEELLLHCFERAGHRVIRNTRYSGDGGIDGRVVVNGALYLIQAKRYREFIASDSLTEFAATVTRHAAGGGLYIHCGRTPAGGVHQARSMGVNIISGQRLLDLVLQEKLAENLLSSN